jgi:SulP family sulfate permease
MSRLRVSRQTFVRSVVAGLIMAVVGIPGGIANGLLAGVNPIYGVYSMIAGTTVAALFTSSVIMNVDSTGATALATFDALGDVAPEDQLGQLVVLSLLVGVFMLALGFLKLGFLVRFISNSVMVGFLSGLGVLTILGQVGDLTGYASDKSNKVGRTIDTLWNWPEIDATTLLVGIVTIVVIVVVNRTRFEKYSFLVGVVFATLLVAVASLDVALVGDSTEIPRSVPSLNLPELALIPRLLLPAAAIAIIALVQAAGVSGSIPNPDGAYPDPSGDFRGQGAANVAVGFVGGIPVGGSLSGTILIQNMGGRSRWANISTGAFTLVSILLIAPIIEEIPMPTLAGLLVVIGFSMINVGRIQTVWATGLSSLVVMVLTFTASLVAPIHIAVALGVVAHVAVHIFRSADAVRLERIIVEDDGLFAEAEAPTKLPSNDVVILQPVGSLFFAGVNEFDEKLPTIGNASGTVVILRLRDRDEVGSTFIRSLERYTRDLHSAGNTLMLEGLNQDALDQMRRTELLDLIGEDNVFIGQRQFGAAMRDAYAAAENWSHEPEGDDPDGDMKDDSASD